MDRDSTLRNHPSSARGFRLLGALGLTMTGLLTLATGCPFSAEEFHRHCTAPSDCSDGNPCTEDKCTAGLCENPFKPKETACGAASASVCDGAGKCVECVSSTDCAANHPMTPICDLKEQKCVSCFDGIKNGKETDVDCGGPDCGPCLGQPCDSTNQCGNNLHCALPEKICCSTACTDKCEACSNAKTGQPDGTCAPIPEGQDPDNECMGLGKCSATPGKCFCEDGIKNGSETDVDCGGGVCPPCGGGKTCGMDTDCAVGVTNCVKGACCNSTCGLPCTYCDPVGQCVLVPGGYDDPFCTGGKTCGANGSGCVGKAGASCGSGGQCLSGVCSAGVCAKSTSGKSCSSDADCVTGTTCKNYFCSP